MISISFSYKSGKPKKTYMMPIAEKIKAKLT